MPSSKYPANSWEDWLEHVAEVEALKNKSAYLAALAKPRSDNVTDAPTPVFETPEQGALYSQWKLDPEGFMHRWGDKPLPEWMLDPMKAQDHEQYLKRLEHDLLDRYPEDWVAEGEQRAVETFNPEEPFVS